MDKKKSVQLLQYSLNLIIQECPSIEIKSESALQLIWAFDRLSLRLSGSTATKSTYVANCHGIWPKEIQQSFSSIIYSDKTDANKDIADIHFVQLLKENFSFNKEKKTLIPKDNDYEFDNLSKYDRLVVEDFLLQMKECRKHIDDRISCLYPEWLQYEHLFENEEFRDSIFPVDKADFFRNPTDKSDAELFQVDEQILEAAYYFFSEDRKLFNSIGIGLEE